MYRAVLWSIVAKENVTITIGVIGTGKQGELQVDVPQQPGPIHVEHICHSASRTRVLLKVIFMNLLQIIYYILILLLYYVSDCDFLYLPMIVVICLVCIIRKNLEHSGHSLDNPAHMQKSRIDHELVSYIQVLLSAGKTNTEVLLDAVR